MTDGTRTRMPALHKELLRIAIFAVGVALLLNVLDSGVALNFVMMALYAALLAQAWNILGGYGGQFSFGHALFFGTGAYVQAIAQIDGGLNPWLAMPLGVLASAGVGVFVGALSFRYG
jgi:branched-chain amino acid transport system permease protein